MSYTDLVPVLIKAIQEQEGRIEGQQKSIDALIASNAALEAQLAELARR